jgi:hypothetical protein
MSYWPDEDARIEKRRFLEREDEHEFGVQEYADEDERDRQLRTGTGGPYEDTE